MTTTHNIQFSQEADEYAVAHLLQPHTPGGRGVTEAQLAAALYILGRVTSTDLPARTFSARTMAKRSRWGLKVCRAAMDLLLAAGLITRSLAPGRSGELSRGPAFDSNLYRLWVQAWKDSWKNGELTWPIASLAKTGAKARWANNAENSAITANAENPALATDPAGVVSPRETTGGIPRGHHRVVSPEDTTVVSPEGTTLKPLGKGALERLLKPQPSAEVEPQASASGYGPAEISAEQPEQPKAEIRFEEPQDQLPVEESSDNVVITANDVTLERVDSSTVDLAEPVAAPCNWVQPGDVLLLNQSIYHVATFREGYIVVRDTADELFLATPWELQAEQQDAAPSAQCRNVSSAAQSILSSIRTA